MKPRLLVIDDSQTARAAVVQALNDHDCEVLEASDGQEGISMAGKATPDLVLLDLNMPGMDGIEFLSKLRGCRELRHVPVIVLTGESARETVLKTARLGVSDYLLKPFTVEGLVSRVSRLVGLRPKGQSICIPTRYEDPVVILLLEDKAAVRETIQAGLAGESWKINVCPDFESAVQSLISEPPHLILASIGVAANAAFEFLKRVRASRFTREVPVFGICIKTALDEQKRALASGFDQIIPKPIQVDKLKDCICRCLHLDMSGRYLGQKDGIMLLRLPSAGILAEDALMQIQGKIAAMVDEGCQRLVFDLTEAANVGPGLVKPALDIIVLCRELDIQYCLIAADSVASEFRRQAELDTAQSVNSWEEVLAVFGLSPAEQTA